MRKHMLVGRRIVFCDQVTFTALKMQTHAYSPKGINFGIYDKAAKMSKFTAMFGCSSAKGLEAVSITHQSPNANFVGEFMKKIKAKAKPKPAIFMDNASWNKAGKVKKTCDQKGMPIIYNRPYFPQGNSVELFNAWAVDRFKRGLLDNFINNRQIDGPTLL